LSQAEQEICIREEARIEADAMILKQIQSMLAKKNKRYQTEEDLQEILAHVNSQRNAEIARKRAIFMAQEELCKKERRRNGRSEWKIFSSVPHCSPTRWGYMTKGKRSRLLIIACSSS
jgi:cation transport regulator ChaB